MTRLLWLLRDASMKTKQGGFSRCFQGFHGMGKGFPALTRNTSTGLSLPRCPCCPQSLQADTLCPLLLLFWSSPGSRTAATYSALYPGLFGQIAAKRWTFLIPSTGSLFLWEVETTGETAQWQLWVNMPGTICRRVLHTWNQSKITW